MEDLTTLFCSIDDFWKHFKNEWEKHLISSEKRKRDPELELSISEMMTIIIAFHQSITEHLNIFTYMFPST